MLRFSTVPATRFFDYGAITVTKVLATTVNEKDSVCPLLFIHNFFQWFLNVVDDCLKTLASHLPIQLILSTLNPIVSNKIDARITFALKMVQRMVESWDPQYLTPYLNEFVPGVVEVCLF